MKNLSLLLLIGLSNTALAAPNDNVPAVNLIQITISLMIVIGLLVGSSFIFKKFGLNRFNNSLAIKVVGGVSVGNNQRIMVIEVGDEWVVLGVTPQQISRLASMPKQEVAPGADNSGNGNKNFSTWMQSALEKYHEKKS